MNNQQNNRKKKKQPVSDRVAHIKPFRNSHCEDESILALKTQQTFFCGTTLRQGYYLWSFYWHPSFFLSTPIERSTGSNFASSLRIRVILTSGTKIVVL
jgi:hypothetical protein